MSNERDDTLRWKRKEADMNVRFAEDHRAFYTMMGWNTEISITDRVKCFKRKGVRH